MKNQPCVRCSRLTPRHPPKGYDVVLCGYCQEDLNYLTGERDYQLQTQKLREENDRFRKALRMLADGIDHPLGIKGAPHFYEAMHWAEGLARLALRE